MDYSKSIKNYLQREIEVINSLDIEMINKAMNELEKAYQNEGTIYICGNGGSASTASHYANDFNKGLSEFLDKKFRIVCLNDNVPTMMAIANDIGYEEIFRFPLINKLKPEDLVIGISGSGNSKNVLNALAYAKECGVRTMGIVGYEGGKMLGLADVSLHVPINNMQVSEDLHMMFDHLMMSVFAEEWHINMDHC